MRKSIHISLRAILFLLVFFSGQVCYAKKVKVGDLYYHINTKTKTAEVTYQNLNAFTNFNYKGLTNVTIPDEISYKNDTYKVISIGSKAFGWCYTLTNIIIPDGITYIGSEAFVSCNRLQTISLPKGLKKIYFRTFCFCSTLSNVSIPEGVTWIGEAAFYGCSRFSSIYIPETVSGFDRQAFAECNNLRSFHYPSWLDISKIGIINKAILKPYSTASQIASTVQSPLDSGSQSNQEKKKVTIRISDVDKNIVQSSTKSTNTYVLIIANEDYEYLDDVKYATNDGKIFKEYCVKTLGVPEKQIFYFENATLGKITYGVERLSYCLNNFAGAKAIVYYCGHGIPDEKTSQAYLIPVDGMATNTSICYNLNTLYKTLSATKAQSITYFMDACFTGANKEGSMLVAARGVARAPKKEVLAGNTIVFSASSGDETAMTLNEEGHGLFTYYLLKKLQETEGNVTYGELATYINQNVKKDAFLINEKPQTPVVATSPAVVNTWKTMKLK